MSQSSRSVSRPLYINLGGHKIKLLSNLANNSFTPKLKIQVNTFLHMLSSGDVVLDDRCRVNNEDESEDLATGLEALQYRLQNVFRWWAVPSQPPNEPPRFRTENQLYHVAQVETDIRALFEQHFPNGVNAESVFALAGVEEFQIRYLIYLRAGLEAMIYRSEFLDRHLPKKIDTDALAVCSQNTPYGYIVHVWRLCVNMGTCQDMTRQYNEVLIDAVVGFGQIAQQLQKNIKPDSGRSAIRSDDDVVDYEIVFYTHFSAIGFDEAVPDKQNPKNPGFMSRQVCPFRTQQNNTLGNMILGSIFYKHDNIGHDYNTTLSSAYVEGGKEPPKSHTIRVEVAESVNDSFFNACSSNVNAIGKVDIFQDKVLYVTVYPNDCYVTVPSLLFNQYAKDDMNYKFELPQTENININTVGKIYSTFGFMGDSSWIKEVNKPACELKFLDRRVPYDPYKTVVYEGQCETIKCTVKDFPNALVAPKDKEGRKIALLVERAKEYENAEDKPAWLKTYWSDPEIQKLVGADILWRARNGYNQYKQSVYNVLVNSKSYLCWLESSVVVQTQKANNKRRLKFNVRQINLLAHGEKGGLNDSDDDGEASDNGGYSQAKRPRNSDR